MRLHKNLVRQVLNYAPLLFFSILLLLRSHLPSVFVFDEVHYVPAAKKLITFEDNLNWVHPPFAKYILGLSWLLFSQELHWMSELYSVRFISIVFGILSLWALQQILQTLRFSRFQTQISVWLTGFNFLWFVQAKTAMLDIFFMTFALLGILLVLEDRQKVSKDKSDHLKYYGAWVLLAFSLSSKWSAVTYLAIAFFISQRPIYERVLASIFCAAVYWSTYLPLGFLKQNAVKWTGIFEYHKTMLGGFDSIATAQHPYLSKWWQWPTLLRPMWYTFEHDSTGREICVWAGGNPILFWTAFPFLIGIVGMLILSRRWRADRALIFLAVFYWVPILFWIVAPRKLQMYYYYLPSSYWVAPILVWGIERLRHHFQGKLFESIGNRGQWILIGFTLLCATVFIYFLPIMTGVPLPQGRFRDYMWLTSWI